MCLLDCTCVRERERESVCVCVCVRVRVRVRVRVSVRDARLLVSGECAYNSERGRCGRMCVCVRVCMCVCRISKRRAE